MKGTVSQTLSEYMLDRFSIGSVIASLLLGTTISRPKNRKYRTSVLSDGSLRTVINRMTSERTITIFQGSDIPPERDTDGEIQDIPQDGITLGTWGIRQGGSLPFRNENEDENTKQQEIEGRDVNHGDRGETQGCSARSLRNGLLEMKPAVIEKTNRL